MYKICRLSRLNLVNAKFWGCSSVGRGKLLCTTVGRKIRNTKNAKFWGCSSVGRAPALQAGGRQFEPDQLHQNKGDENPLLKNNKYKFAKKGVNT